MAYRNDRHSWALHRAKKFLAPLRRMLSTGDDHDTFDRLFNSRHVGDLQVITGIGFLGVQIIVVTVFLVMAYRAVEPLLVRIAAHNLQTLSAAGLLDWGLTVLQAFEPVTTIIAPVLAVYGAVLAWAYKTGSERLGVVDSFACEIGTLCRSAAVVDAVGRNIERFSQTPGARASDSTEPKREAAPLFVSQENYFPVFENGTKDLQVLEAKVVVNITAFYTFMKAARDSMRGLAEIPGLQHDGADPGEGVSPEVWQAKVRDLIYMMFLGFESARRALNMLVEYEPDHDELIIVVLLSELKAYGFLSRHFDQSEDVRYGQLRLRQATYREWVDRVCTSVESGHASHKDWERAHRLLPALRKEYQEALAERATAAGA